MRPILLLFISTLAAHCLAGEDCTIARESLVEPTPKSATIAQSFWQKSSEGSDNIDLLTLIFKDGSVAVIEHKYCSMYNFEVAYYTNNPAQFENTEALSSTLKNLYNLSAIQDKSIDSAIGTMTNRLKEKGYNSEQAIGTGFDSSTKNNQKAEFSISYQPLEDSSIHKAALFIYLGVGGAD